MDQLLGHSFSQVLNQSVVNSFEKNLDIYAVRLRERWYYFSKGDLFTY